MVDTAVHLSRVFGVRWGSAVMLVRGGKRWSKPMVCITGMGCCTADVDLLVDMADDMGIS